MWRNRIYPIILASIGAYGYGHIAFWIWVNPVYDSKLPAIIAIVVTATFGTFIPTSIYGWRVLSYFKKNNISGNLPITKVCINRPMDR